MPWIKPNLQKTEFLRILTGNIWILSVPCFFTHLLWYNWDPLIMHLTITRTTQVKHSVTQRKLSSATTYFMNETWQDSTTFVSQFILVGGHPCILSSLFHFVVTILSEAHHWFRSNRQSSGLLGPLQRSLNYIRTTFRCPIIVTTVVTAILVKMVGAIFMWTLPDTSSAS